MKIGGLTWWRNNYGSILQAYALQQELNSMLSGSLVIGADTAATIELIRDTETGLLYKYGDISDLTQKIEWVLNEKEMARKIAENGCHYMREHMGFSYAILAFILFALYDGSFGGNKVSLLFGSIGTVVNILGGTRGSILCIVAFLLFYLFFSKQYKIILLGIILATIFFMCYDKILASFTELANILGIESRIIDAADEVRNYIDELSAIVEQYI